MKFTVWFYAYDKQGNFTRQYDVFTGTQYQCRKYKKNKSFSWQYKIFKSTF